MRCPICGAKLYAKQICPYCKITDEQILNASNKKVKEYRKTGNTDMIHYTTVIPKDLSRLKIILYTIFLGLVGVNHYYVKRPIRGLFSSITAGGVLLVSILPFMIDIASGTMMIVYGLMYEIFFAGFTFSFLMWFFDVLAVFFKTFKVPVVLGEKGQNK